MGKLYDFNKKYKIRKMLASGGFSNLHLAYDLHHNRNVIMKSIKPGVCNQSSSLSLSDFHRTILNEFEAFKSLSHENIVQAIDFQVVNGEPTIILEFIDGQNLSEIISGPKKYNLGAKISLLHQAAKGIDFAHSRDIVHGDLKPSNIMVDKSWSVKIIDFGTAIIASKDRGEWDARQLTPIYSSPEQLRGHEFGEKSDVFSFGIICFELLTGQHPFYAETQERAIGKILVGELGATPKLEGALIEVDKWRNTFHKVFNVEPKSRYKSCDHFFEDLLNSIQVKEKTVWDKNKIGDDSYFKSPTNRFTVYTEGMEVRELKWEKHKESIIRHLTRSTKPAENPGAE